jgi:general secretion pathway protein E
MIHSAVTDDGLVEDGEKGGYIAGTVGTRDMTPEAFVEAMITRGQLEKADRPRITLARRQAKLSLTEAIIELGLMPERTIAEHLATYTECSLAVPADYPESSVLDNVSREYLQRQHVLPIALDDTTLTLALADPFDTIAIQSFRLITKRTVRIMVAVVSELDAAYQRLYGSQTDNTDIETRVDELSDTDTQRLKDLASEAPVVRLVDQLIAQAVAAKASDIHIEIYEHALRVRLRLDGILTAIDPPPFVHAAALVSRIKILARLDIAERRLPQDGRIRHPVRGKMVDFRVSIVPSHYGERIVLRILDKSGAPQELQGIGFSAPVLATLKGVLARPHGMLLVTGATGSGKTTTLYAALRGLPTAARNVLTIEDPIEYLLPGVSQVQVKPEIGLDFSGILRAFLRQDPDIIMVGEIRDRETAELAIHAALTGHLVLSTLHTNSAIGAYIRLIDMGVPDFLVTSAVEGIIAQRLVRRLCSDCAVPAPLPPEMQELLRRLRVTPPSQDVHKAVGCPLCNGTGYAGRLALAEILQADDEVRRLILGKSTPQEMERRLVETGRFRPLLVDGLEKVLAGITSWQEIQMSLAGAGP